MQKAHAWPSASSGDFGALWGWVRLGRCFHFLSPRPEKQLMFLATMSWEIAKTRLGFPSGLCLPTAVPNLLLPQPRQLQMLADVHRCESLLAQISSLWTLVKAVIIPTGCCGHLHSGTTRTSASLWFLFSKPISQKSDSSFWLQKSPRLL